MRSKKELFVCIIIILFAIMIIYLASQFRELPPILQRGLQPSTFPIICAILIIIFAIAMWLTDDTGKNSEDLLFNRTTAKVVFVFLSFIILLKLDFFLSLILSILAIYILWSKKPRLYSIILLGFILPVFIYILFGLILDVRFPDGIFISYLKG